MGSAVLILNRKSFLNRLFFFFCLAVFAWMFPLSMVNLFNFSPQTNMLAFEVIFSSVVFLPTIALHFAIKFIEPYAPVRAKSDLIYAYIITFIFLFLVWFSDQFIIGTISYNWGRYPQGGKIHFIHALFVIATAIYVVYTLWYGLKKIKTSEGKSKRYYETVLFLIAFFFATVATSDFTHSWGFGFFPVGGVFMSLFVTCITYGIFRHNLLGVSFVIKKSLLYSLLLSIISAIYFSIVYATGLALDSFAASRSFSVTLAILATITLIFKPLERQLQKKLDILFYKQPREVMEKENLLLRQEIQNQDRMRSVSTLAAGMAHEIKNPLTSIKTFAEYLPKKYDDPGFRDKFSKLVVDEVDRVNSIVQQLLDFSKPTEPALRPLNLSEAIDETLSLLSSNLIKSKIELIKNLDNTIKATADKNQLKQALLNLILNSIQSMPTGGTLTISTKPLRSKFVSISIQDTGAGINADHLPHIFDPFYTTKEGGTGLGLAIVHSIITKHGGKIDVSSTVGIGTTVTITLKRHMQ